MNNENAKADQLNDAIENLEIANMARAACGLPISGVVTLPGGKVSVAEPLPRYRTFLVCIRAALLGVAHPLVQHMVQRNRSLDDMKQMEQIMARTARA